MQFCRFFNNPGFCTTCGNVHDGSFQSASPTRPETPQQAMMGALLAKLSAHSGHPPTQAEVDFARAAATLLAEAAPNRHGRRGLMPHVLAAMVESVR